MTMAILSKEAHLLSTNVGVKASAETSFCSDFYNNHNAGSDFFNNHNAGSDFFNNHNAGSDFYKDHNNELDLYNNDWDFYNDHNNYSEFYTCFWFWFFVSNKNGVSTSKGGGCVLTCVVASASEWDQICDYYCTVY